MPDITALDYIAFAVFVANWAGHTLFADHSRWRSASIMKLMDSCRGHWMLERQRRDTRIMERGNRWHLSA